METLVISSVGKTEFRQADSPDVGPGMVLLDVDVVGLCGSDLNTFRGLNPLAQLPRVPGHEIGGTIVAVGADVPADFAPGARGIVVPYSNCGACSACRAARSNACKHNQTLGVQRDGGLSEQLVVPYDKLILNDTLTQREMALVEPLSVGFHAVARGAVQAGDTVLVIGAGMIGVGAILGALARGARVLVAEVSEAKRAMLEGLGDVTMINPLQEDLAQATLARTDGHGADVVIEAVGLPETFRAAVDLVCFAGRVVYVGYAKDEVAYNTALFNLKELDIFGSRNASRADLDAVITYLENHRDLAEKLISRVFPWKDALDALPYWEANRQQTFKVMIELKDKPND
ncbi:zinc-binding alcohol dehydrogenase family protein [Cognatishimia sp. SS12]|uniref:zinc-binding alcohol dehydrogenase family protein n=1 Tax=Cognatishimia sp. SS12 TaxID=2979465 RepID=UPI00232E0234|nr:zinc-binding alcohol dehydrogenase family protein [Cognatishimia sp. SS12]MDC0737785.1 zinc-binding alcohol dehydrogenase family protein [Cognatishimia sp. SS12]